MNALRTPLLSASSAAAATMAIVATLALPGPSWAQTQVPATPTPVPLTELGTAVTEDFDTLASTGTSSQLPAGWVFAEQGNGGNNNGLYTANNGSATAGDTYSYGTTGATDRAFGGLQSGSLIPTFGAQFKNNTGVNISALTIAYTGEQWRLGATGRADRLDFQYSLTATGLLSGTWTDVDGLDFTSPTTTGAGQKDGNLAANRTSKSATITLPTRIANGATFWIRWTDFDATGADDGLAVDDFSLTPNATTAVDWRGGQATARKRGVTLSWRTGRAPTLLGFDAYRLRAGRRTKLNRNVIARGVLDRTGAFRFTDRSGRRGDRYFVVERSLSGARTTHHLGAAR
jgi:hypothetical protein